MVSVRFAPDPLNARFTSGTRVGFDERPVSVNPAAPDALATVMATVIGRLIRVATFAIGARVGAGGAGGGAATISTTATFHRSPVGAVSAICTDAPDEAV